jgi:uncharacterized Zn finger protein
MGRQVLRLNCTNCGEFREYEVEQTTSDGGQIVRCDFCGKRHSDDSVFMVDPYRRYERDEAGELLEDLP